MSRFCWVTIFVKNLDESLKFYQEVVGLRLGRRFAAGRGVEIAFLGNGGTEVELIRDSSRRDVAFNQNLSLGFRVDSLEETIELLTARGIAVQSGPFQPSASTKFFYILDPNGLKIQFVEILD